ARVGDVDDGNAGLADLLQDALADHGVGLKEIARRQELNVLDRHAGVLEGEQRRLGCQLTDILVGIAPELNHADSEHVYVSHGVLLWWASRRVEGRSVRVAISTLRLISPAERKMRSRHCRPCPHALSW